MSTRTLKKQLTTLRRGHDRIAADPEWVARNRSLLLRQIRNTVHATGARPVFSGRVAARASHAFKLFFPQQFAATIRSMSFVSLALLLAVSGWIASVSAAQNSLPGDALYNVKLATEKTELLVVSVVGGEGDKVNTLLRHASNRVDEYRKSKTTDQAKIVIQSLKQSIESTSQSLAQAGSDGNPDASNLAKSVNEKTEQFLISLGDTVATADLEKEVGEATHLIEVAGVKAVQVLAEQNLAGDDTVSQQDVKASVEKKLDGLVTDFSEINKSAAAVTTVVASSTAVGNTPIVTDTSTSSITTPATPLIIATSSVGSSNPDSLPLSSLVVLPAPPATVGEAVKATEQKMVEANKLVEKTVAEAKTLIQNNDLLGALKKVEVLTDVKKDTGAAVNQAKIITDSAAAAAPATAPTATAVAPTTTLMTLPVTPVVGSQHPTPSVPPTAPPTPPTVPVTVQSLKIKPPASVQH